MLEQQIEIVNKLGLHARAAAKLVSVASRFESHIEIHFGSQTADAKSIMAVMMLAASKGSRISIQIDGRDQQEAMTAVTELINNYFEEEE